MVTTSKIRLLGDFNLEFKKFGMRGFCITARCYLHTKLASPYQSGIKFACDEF